VNYQQYDGGLGFELNRADSLPASFSRFVYAVRSDKAAFVFKHQRRQFE
jgi:hypothetical protein